MLVKTSELTGAALDWAVAKCENFPQGEDFLKPIFGPDDSCDMEPNYSYSTNWSQGGPIIEQKNMLIQPIFCGWRASLKLKSNSMYIDHTGDTPLVAAMRCYVASKLGDEVDIPDELLN